VATFAHSNLFRVADARTFEQFCKDFGVTFRSYTSARYPGGTLYRLVSEGGWPSYYLDPDSCEEFEFYELLAQQLDKVAVLLFEITNEDGMWISVNAVAVFPGFAPVSLGLDDIALKARDAFGPDVNFLEGFGYGQLRLGLPLQLLQHHRSDLWRASPSTRTLPPTASFGLSRNIFSYRLSILESRLRGCWLFVDQRANLFRLVQRDHLFS